MGNVLRIFTRAHREKRARDRAYALDQLKKARFALRDVVAGAELLGDTTDAQDVAKAIGEIIVIERRIEK